VHFGVEAVNQVNHMPDYDIAPFHEKDYASGEWLVSKLCPGADVPWATEKKRDHIQRVHYQSKDMDGHHMQSYLPCVEHMECTGYKSSNNSLPP